MNYLLLGVNHKTAPVAMREKLSLDKEAVQSLLGTFSGSRVVPELTVLSTCNRIEIYAATQEPEAAESELIQKWLQPVVGASNAGLNDVLYRKKGDQVVSHLFRVAASLDSQMLGENQITGQVRDAYQIAMERSATGYYLNKLFDRALFVAKRIKSETKLSEGSVSIGSAGVMLAKKIFGSLQNKDILLVGTGKIGQLVLKYLKNENVKSVTLMNRSFDKAKDLESQGWGVAREITDLAKVLPQVDIVLTSIQGQFQNWDQDFFESIMESRKNSPLFIVDLGLPRNVSQDLSEVDNLYLYNLDDLKEVTEENQEKRNKEALTAGDIIDQEVKDFYEKYVAFDALPTITSLGKKFEQIRQLEMEKSLNKLRHLSEQDKKVIEKLTQAIVNRVLQDPILSLKNKRESADSAVVNALKKLFRLDDEEN
ncbi:MAG: glutamyl-tRNA reductase [Deltaproteobacteria bacterium]|nr:glutamyl-tRNA reductase [Deltaproteobacteria bacterium]